MKEAMTVSQFWLPKKLDKDKFTKAFEAYFLGGRAKFYPLVPDAHPRQAPNCWYFELETPTARMSEYQPFLNKLATELGYSTQKFAASGFGFVHSG